MGKNFMDFLFLLTVCLLSYSFLVLGLTTPLKVGFYQKTCPLAEAIVKRTVEKAFVADPGAPAALIRLLFHDCFVRAGKMDDEAKHSVMKPCDKAQRLCETSALQEKEEKERVQPLEDSEDQGRQDLESSVGEKRKRSLESGNSVLQTKEELEKINEMKDQEDQGTQDLDSLVSEKAESCSESERIPGTQVPLLPIEEASWRKFQEFDKGNPISTCYSINASGVGDKKPIDLDHPIVPVLLVFTAKSFNEICGPSWRFHFLDIVGVHYISLSFGYVCYITFEGREEGNLGVFEAKVLINRHDGSKTLVALVRSLRPPVGKKNLKLLAECVDLTREYDMRAKRESVNRPRKKGLGGRMRAITINRPGLQCRSLHSEKQHSGLDYINPGFKNVMY